MAPDMEIRKRLEVRFVFSHSNSYSFVAVECFEFIYLLPYSSFIGKIQVRRYFDKADKDGNGSLTKEEWFNVLNSSGVPTTELVLILA